MGTINQPRYATESQPRQCCTKYVVCLRPHHLLPPRRGKIILQSPICRRGTAQLLRASSPPRPPRAAKLNAWHRYRQQFFADSENAASRCPGGKTGQDCGIDQQCAAHRPAQLPKSTRLHLHRQSIKINTIGKMAKLIGSKRLSAECVVATHASRTAITISNPTTAAFMPSRAPRAAGF